MWQLIFFILVIIGVAVFLWSFNKKKKDQKPQAEAPKALTLDNVGPGGVIHLRNVGPDMEEYDVTILSKSTYREGESNEWYELEGDNGQKKVWLTLEDDDGLDVTLSVRRLKLREIPINRKDLDRMDETAEGEFTFEGDTYYFEYSNEASYFANGNTTADNESFFYYWEFENEDGDKFITIEEWENGKFEISLSTAVKSSNVQVYSLGGNSQA